MSFIAIFIYYTKLKTPIKLSQKNIFFPLPSSRTKLSKLTVYSTERSAALAIN